MAKSVHQANARLGYSQCQLTGFNQFMVMISKLNYREQKQQIV